MYNPLLTESYHATLNDQLLEDVGMEGFGSVVDFFRTFYANLTGPVDNWLNGIKPTPKNTGIDRKLIQLLEEHPYSTVGRIGVYHPAGLNELMAPYLVHISANLQELGTLTERLYIPTINYMSRLLVEPNAGEKAWLDAKLVFVDVERQRATYNTFFDPRIKNRHDSLSKPFSELYRTNRDFIDCGSLLETLVRVTNDLDIQSLRLAESRLIDLSRQYSDLLDEDPSLAVSNRQALKRLVDAMDAIAKETEMLALMVFCAQVARQAIEDSANKLSDVLKKG